MPPRPVRNLRDTIAQRLQNEGAIAKILAVAGVGVTLIGIAMMLALAAQAGLLRPELRVAGGVAAAAGLLGAAFWIHRLEHGRIGAIACAAAGFAAGYLDLIAATRLYEWLPAAAGLAVAGIVAISGMGLARSWDSEHLALLIVVPAFVLAPIVTDSVELLAVFGVLLAGASIGPTFGLGWNMLHVTRSAVATAAGAGFLISSGAAGAAGLVATAGIGLLGIVALGAERAHPIATVIGLAPTLPLLGIGMIIDPIPSAVIGIAWALVLLVISVRAPRLDSTVRAVYGAGAAVLGLVSIAWAVHGMALMVVVLAAAVVVSVTGRAVGAARAIGLSLGVLGGLAFYSFAPLQSLLTAHHTPVHAGVLTAIAGILLTATIGAQLYARVSARLAEPVFWVAGAIALYAVTTPIITLGTALGGTERGFIAGHALATTMWILIAAALLTRPAPTVRFAGLGLAVAAVAKLFLFDLATLDGMLRVGAFLVVGVALLLTGAAYTRKRS